MPAPMNTYARQPVTFASGSGSYLTDTSGKRYLDALSGIAVCGLGHCHPVVTAAIQQQAETLVHTSNLFQIEQQQKLAERLCEAAQMDAVFFGNSGAEANEAAIKIARLHGHARNIAEPTVIVTDGAFHGRTMATLTATGNPKVQAGFAPLVPGFVRVPYNNIAAIEQLAASNPNIVAILVEPIQGEAGIVIPAADYLPRLRQLCDQHNWLLMLDEIQTGMGRTGSFMAYQRAGVLPDVTTLAKSLGNGVPIGACLARGEAAKLLQPGSHGTTYGGNPLVCAAALAVLSVIQEQQLCQRAAELGQTLLQQLQARLGTVAGVTQVRGQGLMLAIELERDCAELVQRGLQAGIVLNVTGGNRVRLLPPLTLTDAEAEQLVQLVSQLVVDFLAATG